MRLVVDGRVLDDRYHGIGRITSELLPQLARADDVELVVVLRPGQTSRRFDVAALTTGLGAEVVTLDHDLTSPRQYLAWPGVLRRARCDVAVFPYNLGASIAGPGRRLSVVHDCIIETDARFSAGIRTRLPYRALTSVVVRRTEVLTPSHASARDVERFYRVHVDDRHVLSWGVDPRFAAGDHSPADAPGATAREVAGQALPARYLLHVGARRPHKNVELLVRALPHLPDDVRLVLVGSVDARLPDPVPATAARLGVTDRVVHVAHVSDDDLVALYAGASAFTYPSLIEGVGLPLLEAMAAGTPVVASDIPVFREIGGAAAVFVDPHDPAAWARAVTDLQDPARRAQLVAAGHEVTRAATWERTGEQLLAVIRRA